MKFNLFFVLLVVLLPFISATGWKQNKCGNQDCQVQFKRVYFDKLLLRGTIVNTGSSIIQGGNLKMTTNGYGCILFFCSWSAGPILDDPACSWPGMGCDGESLLAPGEQKEIFMDFSEAINQAKATTGCCSVDNKCNDTPPSNNAGCMMKGTATFSNGSGTYSSVSIEFSCDSKWTTCTIAQP